MFSISCFTFTFPTRTDHDFRLLTNRDWVRFPSRTHPYSKGMFITLSNSKLYYNHLLGTFKRQYQSVLRGLGIKIGRNVSGKVIGCQVKVRSSISYKKAFLLLLLLYMTTQTLREMATIISTHFMLYNVSQYLPSDVIDLRSAISKIKRANGRYVGNRHKVNGVDVRPVGTYKHYLEHELEDTNYHDYLNIPLNSPRRDCLMNYMANNRHNPDVHYDLTYLYYDEDYLPLNLYNRTILTN